MGKSGKTNFETEDDLFSADSNARREKEQPLAARMRPRTLEEFVGQDHILGPGRLLRRAIQADQLSSIIFYGPPGTGKTTLARVIANTTQSYFITINAVLAGVKAIRQATAQAQERYNFHGQRTILFVDEVHRWNKAQQDALLPWVENGTIILIGATTENPFFEVNRALVSRSRIFQLKPLTEADLYSIARSTLQDAERGYGGLKVQIDKDALAHLVDVASGDARTLLNALELAVETTPDSFPPPKGDLIHITLPVAEESIQRRVVLYDKEGDYHFDTISAFIKSLRGSDPDAALYWLAKMVYAGEDPRYIFRRLLIQASEDVGLADPQALAVIEGAAAAFDRVGLPEGRFHLAQAVLYLATAPKSNSTMAFFDALNTVEKEQEGEVPNHLKDENRDGESFGHGQGYLYPHAYREHWTAQQYLPDHLQGKLFYQPGDRGYEAGIAEQVKRRREAQLAAMLETERKVPEVLSFSSGNKARDLWLERAASASGEQLGALRDRLLAALPLARHHVVLDLAAGSGLLTWELARRVPEGSVWALTGSQEEAGSLRSRAEALPELERPIILTGEISSLSELLAEQSSPGLSFDAVVGYHALTRQPDQGNALAGIAGLLKSGAMLSLAETIPSLGTRLSDCLHLDSLEEELAARIRRAEERIYQDAGGSPLGWGKEELLTACRQAGLQVLSSTVERLAARRRIRTPDLERWFALPGKGVGERPNYALYLARELSPEEIRRFGELCREQLAEREIDWQRAVLLLSAKRASADK